MADKGFINSEPGCHSVKHRANVFAMALAKERDGYALPKGVLHCLILLSARECSSANPQAAFFGCGKSRSCQRIPR